ncbi:DUF1501 domain-containing protein [Desertihabitans aurantiacus]|uniref:DUF1501 domain-containing protein n=1 Tax=Desertihabitans aurantiacus TaxID=2282477 RepID=UPI0018E4FCA2|nr:DUF1501 domain-containing protein [Desertihabitans aurantiacus]
MRAPARAALAAVQTTTARKEAGHTPRPGAVYPDDDLGAEQSRVTVVTLSEFGRRLTENASGGLDHGHGNLAMVLGGGVNGGKVYGRWPGLSASALVDGDLAGTTDYRTILAEVVERRQKLSATTVFPGVSSTRLGLVRAA